MFDAIVEDVVETFGPNGECLVCGQTVSPDGACACFVPYEQEFDNFLIVKYAEEYGYEREDYAA